MENYKNTTTKKKIRTTKRIRKSKQKHTKKGKHKRNATNINKHKKTRCTEQINT